MDDVLQRLLDAELRAQKLVDEALAKKEETLEEARNEVLAAEEEFETRMQALREELDAQAEKRAADAIAELEARFASYEKKLQVEAETHRASAADAAMKILTDFERI